MTSHIYLYQEWKKEVGEEFTEENSFTKEGDLAGKVLKAF